MSTAWALKEIASLEPALTEHFDLHSVTLRVLAARGIRTPEAITHYLHGGLLDLADPFLLPGMDLACQRIFKAVRENELIMLHGDYDVDGVTSAAITALVLQSLGGRFITYIPERKSGYGFNESGVRFAKEKEVRLIITLDCGITSEKEIAEAKQAGIDTIVIDHHQIPSSGVPKDASAVVNPWLDPQASESFLELSAAGLAFKLACALVGETAHRFVDIAAVGTVADVSPLVDENRLIVKAGLSLLTERSHMGFAALLKSAAHRHRRITARHIGFIIAPRLNAGGRMDSGVPSYELLIANNLADAERLAGLLEKKNSDRRSTEKQMVKEAFEKCDREINFNRERVIVLWSEKWHPGVIGIVAARLVDKYYRPAIVISLADTTKLGKGSGRSIRGFNIYHGLKAVSEHLSEFGGHEFAAGFTIDPNKLATFRAALNRYAEDALEPTHLIRPIDIDVEVPFSNLTVRLAQEITLLAPFGSGNPEPVFLTRNLRVKKEGKTGSKFSAEFWVTDGEQVIGVSAKNELAERIRECETFDLAYTLELDNWEGQASVSLVAKDIKPIAPAFCIS